VQETETDEDFKEFYGSKATNKPDAISPNTKNTTGIRVVTSPHLKQFKKQVAVEKTNEDNNNDNSGNTQQIGFESDEQGWLPKRSKSNLSEMQM
jgi:hypothetical protein